MIYYCLGATLSSLANFAGKFCKRFMTDIKVLQGVGCGLNPLCSGWVSVSKDAHCHTCAKVNFARHAIPEILGTNSGPQHDNETIKLLAERYGFWLITSSPHYLQGNGLAARTVQTVKRLIKSSEDPQLALLAYRTTPFPWSKSHSIGTPNGAATQNNSPYHYSAAAASVGIHIPPPI